MAERYRIEFSFFITPYYSQLDYGFVRVSNLILVVAEGRVRRGLNNQWSLCFDAQKGQAIGVIRIVTTPTNIVRGVPNIK